MFSWNVVGRQGYEPAASDRIVSEPVERIEVLGKPLPHDGSGGTGSSGVLACSMRGVVDICASSGNRCCGNSPQSRCVRRRSLQKAGVFQGEGQRDAGTPVAVPWHEYCTHRTRNYFVEAMMGLSRAIGLMIAVSGELLVSACAPPTPKVEPSIAPPVMERTSHQRPIRLSHSCAGFRGELLALSGHG